MFKAARWRSEKNKIKAVFKLQFKATQVPGKVWETMMVSLVPIDVGKPSQRSEKTAIADGACQWPNPIYETVKLSQDQKTGKISDKVYQFIVSATGLAKSGVLGEININLADYAEVLKPTSVSLPLQDSNNGAILHVTIQRVHGDVEGRENVENGEIPKENIEKRGTTLKPQRKTLKSQLGNPEYEDGDRTTNGASDINSAEEGSFINNNAMVKFHSSRSMPPHDDSSGNLRKSSSFDAMSASGSESSSGRYTPMANGIKNNNAHKDNASSLSSLSNSDTPRNTDWPLSSAPNGGIAGSTNNSGETGLRERVPGSENTLEKQKSDLDTLARQLEVSEMELQTLRKQVVKESRRGQDLSKELGSLKEERDALEKECEELRALKKRAAEDRDMSAMLQFGTKDPWSTLAEMKEELDHEKTLNANLRVQLQKTQESNSELIFAVKDLEELLELKNREKPSTQENSQEMNCQNQMLCLRDSEVNQDSFEMTSDHEEEQCELDILIKKRDDIRIAHSHEQKILDLNSELEWYKKDREELEMQMEQLALDYEILKQENHDISSRLEQIQLREQLRMQYECSAHSAIINDLESHVESLEKELEKQAEAYEAELATTILAKVEQEQKAIRAEEELNNCRWTNAKSVEQLQIEFKRLASQLSTTVYANEDLVMKTLEESRDLKLEKSYMAELLDKKNEELSSLQRQHQVKCQQLLRLIDFKTNEVDRLTRELRDKKEELENHKKSEEATQKVWREEISILKAEMEELSTEKNYLSADIEQKESLVTEIEKLKASTKEIEMLLQERNLENEILGKELSMLKDEGKKSLEELDALRHLKDEQEATIKTLNLKLQTVTTQYTDMKQCLTDDGLEKENLRKQVFLLRGDLRKDADIISSIEKKLKDNNAKLMVPEGKTMIHVRSKSKQFLHAAPDSQTVAALQEDSKHFDSDSDTNKNFEHDDMNDLNIQGGHLHEKMAEDKEHMNIVDESNGEGIRSNLNTKMGVEALVSCTYDQQKVAEILSDMVELKERNELMEAELKDMQERYSEMSLKFAEVEGERQQLVIRVRSLKNALKN